MDTPGATLVRRASGVVRTQGDLARASLPLLIVLFAAVVAHAVNIVDFPAAGPDEGLTLHRALACLRTGSVYDDQTPGGPFFGWVILAAMFWALGFPDPTIASSLSLRGAAPLSSFTIWTFWFVPRVIMVALVVVDTYLVYHIGRRLVCTPEGALAAAAIFAVAPLGLYYRLVLLDNIAMASLLGSFALLLASEGTSRRTHTLYRLGAAGAYLLAVLTSLVSVFLLPVALLLLRRTRHTVEEVTPFHALPRLAWAVAVMMVILIWPLTLILRSIQGVAPFPGPTIILAADRGEILLGLLRLDPFLLGLGSLGLLFALAARRSVVLLWALGTLAYGLVNPTPSDTPVIPLVPALALAAGDLVGRAGGRKRATSMAPRRSIAPALPATLATLGLSLVLLTQTVAVGSQDASTPQIQAVQYAMEHVAPDGLVISNPAYWWIMEEFDHRFTAIHWRDPELKNLTSVHGKIYLIVDRGFLDEMGDASPSGRILQRLYLQSDPVVAFGGPTDPVEVRERLMSTLVARVHFPSGNPQVGSRLVVTPAGDTTPAYAATTSNGTHVLNLKDGAYSLEAFDAAGASLGARRIDLHDELTVAFLDAPGRTLHALGISVRFENGDPAAWAFAQVNNPPGTRLFADRNRESNYLLFIPQDTYRVEVQGTVGQPLETRVVALTTDQDLGFTEARPSGVARTEHDLMIYLLQGDRGVGDAFVSVRDASGREVARGSTSFDGRYAVRLSSGSYSAQITSGRFTQTLSTTLTSRDFVRVVQLITP